MTTPTPEDVKLVTSAIQSVTDLWEMFRAQGWDKDVCNAMTGAAIQLIATQMTTEQLTRIATNLEENRL